MREVRLNIGKSIYVISTPLSDEELERVKAVMAGVFPVDVKGMTQENALVLAALRLSYALDGVSSKLEALNAELDRLDSEY